MSVILISGNISAGKSTVSELLAEHLGVRLFKESVDDNPFLDQYYKDGERWAFTTQVYFLCRRLDDIRKALADDNYILDRSIYEDKEIFANIQFENKLMTLAEYQTYLHLFDTMMAELNELALERRPDLLIHLEGSIETILHRWKKRSRECEMQDGMVEYLTDLNKRYEKWIETFNVCPVLRVNIDEIDVTNEEQAKKFLQMVDEFMAQHR